MASPLPENRAFASHSPTWLQALAAAKCIGSSLRGYYNVFALFPTVTPRQVLFEKIDSRLGVSRDVGT